MGTKGSETTKLVTDYVTGSFGLVPVVGGGASVIGTAIKQLMDRRIERFRAALLEDLRTGKITPDEAIEEDALASFILRIGRACADGYAQKKLTLMARYFFRQPAGPDQGDAFLGIADIIERLSDDDLRSLAIIKNGIETGTLVIDQRTLPADDQERFRKVDDRLDLLGLFPSHTDFVVACKPLLRFGFLDLVSGWGALVIRITPVLISFLENVELDEVTP